MSQKMMDRLAGGGYGLVGGIGFERLDVAVAFALVACICYALISAAIRVVNGDGA